MNDLLKEHSDQLELITMKYVMALLEKFPYHLAIAEIKARIKELENE